MIPKILPKLMPNSSWPGPTSVTCKGVTSATVKMATAANETGGDYQQSI